MKSRLGLPSASVRRPAERIAGADRWETSVAVARKAASSARTVVVVSGHDANLVDGLVAGPFARSLGAPVLLVQHNGLPEATRAELLRRRADRAFVVGGPGAVGDATVAQMRALGISVERLAGADRYATASAVAARMGAPSQTAVVASGEAGSLVDALASSGPAAALARPILLVRRDSVPPSTAKVLRDLGIRGTTCVGGAGVLSERVRQALPACYRAGGDDRWQTAAAVARTFRPLVSTSSVTVTSGRDANLVDALGAGTLGHLVLLAPGTSLAASIRGWLQETPSIVRLRVVGGTGAVSGSVLRRMRDA
jgi:putative cell wall-binding protein